MENTENSVEVVSSDENITVEETTTSTISQDDFYNFNNNFVTSVLFLAVVSGVVVGCLIGGLFRGIFND